MYEQGINPDDFQEVKESRFEKPSDRPHVTIYSDGSYKPQIGYGGYGTLMTCNNQSMLIYGGSPADSNNRMELTAVLTALRRLRCPCDVTVISDSQYVVNALNGYIWNWVNNDWKTTKGQPVANQDLWLEMLYLIQIHNVHGEWIKGHNDHPENTMCDEIATYGSFRSAGLYPPYKPSRDLLRGKSPGYEDVDEIPDYEIPYRKLR